MPTKTAEEKQDCYRRRARQVPKAEPEPREALNLAVVRGVVSSPPERAGAAVRHGARPAPGDAPV